MSIEWPIPSINVPSTNKSKSLKREFNKLGNLLSSSKAESSGKFLMKLGYLAKQAKSLSYAYGPSLDIISISSITITIKTLIERSRKKSAKYFSSLCHCFIKRIILIIVLAVLVDIE